MPAFARSRIVEADAVGIYPCVNRCVRRAILCGRDTHSGRSFEHRRTWIQQRLETLAGLFAVEVLGFAVLANHLHLVLRIRPDLAQTWGR
jgi:REP element-mobilizing transposase RayT